MPVAGWGRVAWVAICVGALPVRGDVLHLVNGRAIQGEVTEHGETLVVRSASGRISIPRAQVARIERESRGSLLLAEGRRAERVGDERAAAAYYQRALEQGEAAAGPELSRLSTQLVRDDPGDAERRLAQAATALAMGEAERARSLAEAVCGDESRGRQLRLRAHYVLGRALEALDQGPSAAQAYRAALTGLEPPSDLDALRELARLRYVGARLGPGIPGLGEGWAVRTSPQLLIVARPAHVHALQLRASEALDDVRARLELPALGPGRRVTVFVHDDQRAYRSASGTHSWAGGHASWRASTGESARVVHLTHALTARGGLEHELAHALLHEVLAGHRVPPWLHEGAASWAEPLEQRRLRWSEGRAGLGPDPAARLLAVPEEPFPGDETPLGAVRAYYGRAALLFAALARRLGPRRAIEVSLDSLEPRPDLRQALSRAGLSGPALRLALEAVPE